MLRSSFKSFVKKVYNDSVANESFLNDSADIGPMAVGQPSTSAGASSEQQVWPSNAPTVNEEPYEQRTTAGPIRGRGGDQGSEDHRSRGVHQGPEGHRGSEGHRGPEGHSGPELVDYIFLNMSVFGFPLQYFIQDICNSIHNQELIIEKIHFLLNLLETFDLAINCSTEHIFWNDKFLPFL